jgi:hypothetical protein
VETAPWLTPTARVLAGSVSPNFWKIKMSSSKKTKVSGRKSLISKKRVASSEQSDRCIFSFYDGTRQRKIDPMEVQNTLNTIPDFDLDIDFKMATSELIPDKEKNAALQRVINAIRKAFWIAPYCDAPESGLTGGECMSVFVDFAGFIDGLKKRLDTLQISSPSVVSQDVPSPTPSNVASSPIEPESSLPNPSFTQLVQLSSSEGNFPESGPQP